MTGTSTLRSAAATALIAGSLAAVGAAAHYLGTQNRGEVARLELPARYYASALAKLVEKDPSPPAVHAAAAKLQAAAKELRSTTVIVEPTSTKYRFLRKRRFLYHSVGEKIGQTLDKRSAADKVLYDAATVVRRTKTAQLHITSPQNGPLLVRAAAPVFRDGKHAATVVVFTQPKAKDSRFPAWPLGLALLALLCLGVASGLFLPAARYALIIVGTLGYGLFAWWWTAQLARAFDGDLVTALRALQQSLGVADRAAANGATGGSASVAFLFAGVLLGIGSAALAMVGVGARIVSALRDNRLAYSLLLPAGLGMGLLVFLPFSYGLGLGFFNHAHGEYTFVGLSNFVEILSGGGRPLSHPLNFYFTLGVTVLWTAVNVFLHVAIGLALALILKDPLLRFRGVYRALLILPWAMPNYITALIWKGMFHYQYGAVNHVLDSLGLEKVSWFSSFSTAFIANVTTNTWLGFPFMMVVALGALQSIPSDVYEAAAVDGAPKWQVFWRITMPLLKPALYPAIVLGSIWTFNMFNIIYLVSAGAPNGSSDILITEAYRWAFERGDKYGLAAAYALIIFVILWGYSKLANRLARISEEA